MKKSFFIYLCISVILTLFSCSNEFVPDILIENKISTSEEIVLGEKRENPFSISKARSVDSTVVPNYIYLKIRTNIVENVELIEAILGDLNTVPLDYEVIEGGCINTQNSGSDEFTPWFYSMTTIEKYNEVKDLGETEVIDEMYISEEDFAKFTDIETENEKARFLWVNYKKVKPTGHVYFYDEVKDCYVPLKGVKVTVRQWCHEKTVYTDETGYYNIGENFTTCWQNTATVKVTFETKKDCIYPEWSLVKATYNSGSKKVADLKDNDIYLAKNTTQNNYGILMNATKVYRDFAKADGVTEPENLKFWASSSVSGGVTLMRDVIIADSASVGAIIGTIVTPGLGTVLGTITSAALGAYFPDIIVSTKKTNSSKTESITEIVFHEMAHASHYTGIGAGQITYWNLEYIKMLGGWIEVLCNDSSPMEDCYNGGKSKQVCFIESWGYFYGYYLMRKYYQNYSIYNYYERMLETSENFLPYFYYDAFYDTSGIISVKQIFEPYKYFSVQSIDSWFEKIKEKYSNKDLQEKIEKIFEQHGITL